MLVDRRCIGPVNARTPLATGPLRTGGFVSRIGHRGAGRRAAVERLHSTAPVRVRCGCCAGRIRIYHVIRCGPAARERSRLSGAPENAPFDKYLSLLRVSVFSASSLASRTISRLLRGSSIKLLLTCATCGRVCSHATHRTPRAAARCSIRRTDLVETQAP